MVSHIIGETGSIQTRPESGVPPEQLREPGNHGSPSMSQQTGRFEESCTRAFRLSSLALRLIIPPLLGGRVKSCVRRICSVL